MAVESELTTALKSGMDKVGASFRTFPYMLEKRHQASLLSACFHS